MRITVVRLVTCLHQLLMRLYPGRFRAEFGDEMQAVFRLAVEEAAQRSQFSVVLLGWRELRDLPWVAIREHQRDMRNRMMEERTRVLAVLRPDLWRNVAVAILALGVFLCATWVWTVVNLRIAKGRGI